MTERSECTKLPVPPEVVGSAVPERVSASVPEDVIGDPAIERKLGTVAATEVTVPTPGEAGVVHERMEPFEVSTCPLVPTAVRPGALATMISGECSEVT